MMNFLLKSNPGILLRQNTNTPNRSLKKVNQYKANRLYRKNLEKNLENMDFFDFKGSKDGALGSKLGNFDWDNLVLSSIKKDVYQEHPDVADMTPEEVKEARTKAGISFLGKVQPPNPVESFDKLTISKKAVKSLKSNFEKPTSIQANTWPAIMKGLDLVGSAETGSGKTLSFLIPALEHIVSQEDTEVWPKVLVIAPTRELVRQIWETSLPYARDYQVHSLYAHGGSANRSKQENDIRRLKPEMLIAAPGRIIDFVENGLISLEHVSMFVMDEADLLLQMGFEDQLKMILSQVRPDRQAVMFSATWPSSVQHLAKKYFRDYVHLNVGSLELSANPKVTQSFSFVRSHREKIETLIKIIDENPEGKFLVFVKTKSSCETIKEALLEARITNVGTMHGDHTQSQRENELAKFHSGQTRILMSTDLASRGLDVKDIKHVVNFDMPESISPYIHRIGRTARAGETGDAYSFITPGDFALVPDLVKVLEEAGQEVPRQLETSLKRTQSGIRGRSEFSNKRFDFKKNDNRRNNKNQRSQQQPKAVNLNFKNLLKH
eukprot:TRINITY_DN126_c0_g2_i1.p1 TRINITY_DN126_c0_g2~~TRINITY_DN126_c0_g2_i1.p1  ORF type:complete len:550 (+),score=132.13 TRINITY_DN126_c0_g2_i1:70-1719(+)